MEDDKNILRAVRTLKIMGFVGLLPLVIILYTIIIFSFDPGASGPKTAGEMIEGIFMGMLLSLFGLVPLTTAWGLKRRRRWAMPAAFLIGIAFIVFGSVGTFRSISNEINEVTRDLGIVFNLLLAVPGVLLMFFLRRAEGDDKPL